MLDSALFDKLEQIACNIRCNRKPFGGIQLVLVGDFFQLPPCEKGAANVYVASRATLCVRRFVQLARKHLECQKWLALVFLCQWRIDMIDLILLLVPLLRDSSYCFEAESWSRCVPHVVQLTQIFRQKESKLIDMLNEASVLALCVQGMPQASLREGLHTSRDSAVALFFLASLVR